MFSVFVPPETKRIRCITENLRITEVIIGPQSMVRFDLQLFFQRVSRPEK
jgi:hypothetical protein